MAEHAVLLSAHVAAAGRVVVVVMNAEEWDVDVGARTLRGGWALRLIRRSERCRRRTGGWVIVQKDG